MQSRPLSESKIKVAVVGVGYWGRNIVRNFHELGALALLCDADRSIEEGCRHEYESVRFCRDFSVVLSDPSIAAVALATPAATHYEMAKAALEAGKDVLVEKPLAIDVKQGEDLVELAASKRRILMVGHILRYHPAVLKLQELIQEGALGQINYLYSNRLNIGKIRTEENILWSFAPHDISVMLSLLNEAPNRVTCQGGAYLNHHIFDVTLSLFEFNDFAVGFHGRRYPVPPFDFMGIQHQLVFGGVIEHRHLFRPDHYQPLLFKGMQPAYKDVRLYSAGKVEVAQRDVGYTAVQVGAPPTGHVSRHFIEK